LFRHAWLLAALLVGCAPSTVDHFAQAQAIERQILRKNPQAGYDDPRFVHVLRKLDEVPADHPTAARAQALAQSISDARRIAASKHEAVGHLPKRLVGVKPAAPVRRGPLLPKTAGSSGKQMAARAKVGDLDDDARSKLDITLYSTSWCGYCKRARSWFAGAGIPFEEHDIEADPAANAAYKAAGRGYSGVPLIVVNGTPVRGFDKAKIERLIAKAVEG